MKAQNLGGAVAVLAAAGAAVTVSAATAAGAVPAGSHTPAARSGLVAFSNAHGSKFAHGLGAKLDKPTPRSPRSNHSLAVAVRRTASVPGSYSLAQYDNGAGDQGQVGSCVSWAIDYSAFNILENEQGISGGPQAPMYTYAQIAQGNDERSTPDETFEILTSQGVDDRSDYWQGDFDYTTQPDVNERANAANWKLSGYTPLRTGLGAKADIEESISSGLPVAISIEVHQSWMDISSSDAAAYTYMPGNAWSDPVLGGHEVTIIGYNSQGVRIENSWNTSWGDGGYINVPWKFVTQQVEEANAVGKLVEH
jgi:C1A family cysteine protease